MVETDIVVPRNREAEEAVIGGIIQGKAPYLQASRKCVTQDFYDPAHEKIWGIVADLVDAGTPVDAMAVMQELLKRNQLREVGGSERLAALISTPWAGVNIEHYAAIVHETARARRMLQTQMRMGQIMAETAGDHDQMLNLMAKETLAMEMHIDERAADAPLDGLMRWSELWNLYSSETVEWLIEDLLVAEDVFMLLGGEGGGKSWVARQFCLTIAAGVHPFIAHKRIPPLRSLLVDLENAPAMVAYESRMIGNQVARLGDFNDELAQVWLKEDGLNLRDRSSAMLLERAIAETQPQVVALGSLYKAFSRGRDDWDTAAEETREVLDRLRRRYKFALVIEHHMPKATGGSDRPQSPFGSSVWQRWPSIGQTLHRVGDNMYALEEFRGTRLKRQMPLALVRGGELPWTPVWDRDEMEFGMWDELKPKKGNGKTPRRPTS